MAAIALVQRDWKHFPLSSAQVVTLPTSESLANASTKIASDIAGTDTVTRTILGLQVVVHAVVRSYTWRFGDGSSSVETGAGGPPSAVTHRYLAPAIVAVSLDVTYAGTFTVAGSDEVYDLQGTATVQGPTVPLVVLEAHTQLEGG